MIKGLISPSSIKAGLFYFSSFGTGILRYVFHLLLLRFLSPSYYGEFLAYLSLLFILSVPSGTVGTLVVRQISKINSSNDPTKINQYFYRILKYFFIPSVVIGLFLITLAEPLSGLLKTQPQAFLVLAFFLMISIPSTVLRSILTALEKLPQVAAVSILEVLLTIVFTFILLNLQANPVLPVIAQVLGSVGGIICMTLLLRKFLWPINQSPVPYHLSIKSDLIASLFYSLALASLISTDNLSLRVILPPTQSGYYAALSTIARSFYFALGPLATIVFTTMANRAHSGRNPLPAFAKLFLVQGSLSSLFLCGAIMFPSQIVSLLGGGTYQSISYLLPLQVGTALLLSLSVFLVSALMGLHYRYAAHVISLVALLQPLALRLADNLVHGVYINLVVQFVGSLALGLITFRILLQFRQDGQHQT